LVSEAREATPIVLEICTEDLLPCIDRCVILFKCMVGDASVDWLSVASAVIDVMTRLADIFFGPKLECVGITGSVIRAVTDVLHSREFHFLVCGARIRAIPNRISGKYVVKEVKGKVEIYDYQGRLVHGSLSVWIPNHDDFWAFSKTVIGKETHLPVSVDVTGEGTLLLLLAYSPTYSPKEEGKSIECPIKSPDESALIILPDLPPGAATWQPLADSACFNYNGYNGQPICNVRGSLRPNYKVRFMVDSHNACGMKHELTLSELLDKCVSSCKNKGQVIHEESTS